MGETVRMCPPLLLATLIDIPASSGVLITGGVVMAALVAIPAFNGVLSIIAFFRKTPPDHDKYATKSELDKMGARISDADVARKQEMTALEAHLSAAAAERWSGVTSSRARGEQRMIEIEARITHQLDQGQVVFNSMQREHTAISTAVGELRGEIRAMREMNKD